jgi:hypothetical protein
MVNMSTNHNCRSPTEKIPFRRQPHRSASPWNWRYQYRMEFFNPYRRAEVTIPLAGRWNRVGAVAEGLCGPLYTWYRRFQSCASITVAPSLRRHISTSAVTCWRCIPFTLTSFLFLYRWESSIFVFHMVRLPYMLWFFSFNDNSVPPWIQVPYLPASSGWDLPRCLNS